MYNCPGCGALVIIDPEDGKVKLWTPELDKKVKAALKPIEPGGRRRFKCHCHGKRVEVSARMYEEILEGIRQGFEGRAVVGTVEVSGHYHGFAHWRAERKSETEAEFNGETITIPNLQRRGR